MPPPNFGKPGTGLCMDRLANYHGGDAPGEGFMSHSHADLAVISVGTAQPKRHKTKRVWRFRRRAAMPSAAEEGRPRRHLWSLASWWKIEKQTKTTRHTSSRAFKSRGRQTGLLSRLCLPFPSAIIHGTYARRVHAVSFFFGPPKMDAYIDRLVTHETSSCYLQRKSKKLPWSTQAHHST
jgi:hypothetical protein